MPPNGYPQEAIPQYMKAGTRGEKTKAHRQLTPVFRHSAIATRYSVLNDFQDIENSWFATPPSIEQRMAQYEVAALALGKKLVAEVSAFMELHNASLGHVTHLVWVSCTGMTAPGLELQLRQAFNFRPDLETTAFNFLGCHGFFHALRFASSQVKANPKNKILIVCVELCTLHFQQANQPDQVLANAIFADGGAATVVSGEPLSPDCVEMLASRQFIFPPAAQSMGWRIGSKAFNMVLEADLPQKVGSILRDSVAGFLMEEGLSTTQIAHWICHPGGRKILDAIQLQLALNPSDLCHSRAVLQAVGNVSSASVLFVLQACINQTKPSQSYGLMLGLGPGLSLEAALFRY